MEVVHLFSGNALGVVGAEGEIRLPPFVLKVLARRAAEGRILFGAHESAPCLTAFDAGYLPVIGDEIERLKRRDEARDASGHADRARRAFGLTEEADVDAGGRVGCPRSCGARAGSARGRCSSAPAGRWRSGMRSWRSPRTIRRCANSPDTGCRKTKRRRGNGLDMRDRRPRGGAAGSL